MSIRRSLGCGRCFAIPLLFATSCAQGQQTSELPTPVEGVIGRPVRIVSLAFHHRDFAEILDVVDREAARGTDLIVLPETWRGQDDLSMERIDGPTITALAKVARLHSTYILSPIDLLEGQHTRRNAAVLIDRGGKVAGVYHKVFPFLAEFDHDHPVLPGDHAPVFDTDFGKLGVAICFDVNFPEVWQSLSDGGAELVIWPSAYSAGNHLQAYALLHHYYIVTATLQSGDIQAYDITGRRILDQPRQGSSEDVNIARLTLDLDRGIYHENYNGQARQELFRDHLEDVEMEAHLRREQWIVLRAKRPGISARDLAAEYGMEELRDYIARSRVVVASQRESDNDRESPDKRHRERTSHADSDQD